MVILPLTLSHIYKCSEGIFNHSVFAIRGCDFFGGVERLKSGGGLSLRITLMINEILISCVPIFVGNTLPISGTRFNIYCPLDFESTLRCRLATMNTTQETLTIQEAAEATGLTTHTLRYYERIGLLAPIGRAANSHRRY